MRVVFRVDASVQLGTGHMMRCLTLADQLRGQDARIAVVSREIPVELVEIIRARGFEARQFDGGTDQADDARATVAATTNVFSEGADWIVVDHYGLDATWGKIARRAARKLMVIDDLANRRHDCDLLLDQNYYRDADRRYDGLVPDSCTKLLGPRHLLLQKGFAEARRTLRRRDGSVKRILVFLGGTDPTNETERVLKALRPLGRSGASIDVVVGAANPSGPIIEQLSSEAPNVSFHRETSNMAQLIASADIGIGAAGSAMWERCYLGLPTLTVVTAANQERSTRDVAAAGAIDYLGLASELSTEHYVAAIERMMGDPDSLRRIGSAALEIVPEAGDSVAVQMRTIGAKPAPLT